MDNEALSKELVGIEERPIVSASDAEELIDLVAKLKAPRLENDYRESLKYHAFNRFNIMSAEFDNMTPYQIKILERGLINGAREELFAYMRNDKFLAYLGVGGMLLFGGAAYFLSLWFFLGVFAGFITFSRSMCGSDDEYRVRNLLTAYEGLNRGKQNE